jgi:hypothetical protein
MLGLECPRSAPINGSDAPPLTNCEANECRKSWMRRPVMAAALVS